MNKRLCKNCLKVKEKHISSSYPYEFVWCYPENTSKKLYDLEFEEMTNLEYLEYKYNENIL